MADEYPMQYGPYQLLERFAVGGMAELFLATMDGAHGFVRKVIIKRLLPHLAREANYNAMFIDEAKLTARLVHPKIAQTYELGRVDDSLFIAMEYIDGIDCLAMLRECAHRKQKVPVGIAAWVAHEVLDALDFAHSLADDDGTPFGIVHRDISPSNVLLSRRGDVKLVDFGIARMDNAGKAHKSKSGTLKGKYGYMSPEQVTEQPLDGRSDVFSVGILLAEMLCGRRLFTAPNELDVLLMVRDAKLTRLDQFGTEIEDGLNEILRRALRKSLDERFQSAAEMRDALGEWMYEKRLRVTPQSLGAFVETLHEQATKRRQESAGASVAANLAVVQAVPNEHATATNAVPAPRETTPIATGSAPRVARDNDSNAGFPSIDAALAAATDGGNPNPLQGADFMLPAEILADAKSDPGMIKATPHAETYRKTTARTLTGDISSVFPRSGSITGSPRPETNAGATASANASGATHAGTGRSGSITGSPTMSKPRTVVTTVRRSSATGMPTKPPEAARVTAPIAIAVPEPSLDPDNSFDDTPSVQMRRSRARISIPPMVELQQAREPLPPEVGEQVEPPDEGGEFAAYSPVAVMFGLMMRKITGLLVVSIGGIKKEIYFRDGKPEFVSSNMSGELFGNYLVDHNIVSSGELAMALAMMPHFGGKLGDTLVGLGLMKPLEVFRHLTLQVRSKLVDVCTWSKGSYGFYRGRENPREAFPVEINPVEVWVGGALAQKLDVIDEWLTKFGEARFEAVAIPPVSVQQFEHPLTADVCRQCNGTVTVNQLVKQRNKSEQPIVVRLLYLLEQCGMISKKR
ncbi:MAG: protein kinase [Myxococcales bacterium]|nr:protein kinase [Myxococcales bacterium]